MNQTVEYIKELTAIASPTGFTREITNYLVETLEKLGYQPIRTAKGGVNVTVKGKNDEQQRYVTAHVDTLSFALLNQTVVLKWTVLVATLGI